MPKGRHHHMLDSARLPVGKQNASLLRTGVDGRLRAFNGRRILSAASPDSSGRIGRDGFSVPIGISKVMVRLYEVVDGEIVLAFVQSRAAADDLLELDHRA